MQKYIYKYHKSWTLANPSAVPVWVPKRMVTFLWPSSCSGSGSLTIKGLGGSKAEDLDFGLLDLLHTNTTTHPIKTAIDVVKIITKSRFSMNNVATSAADSDDAFDGSIFRLIIADIRSSGETFNELLEDCMVEFIRC